MQQSCNSRIDSCSSSSKVHRASGILNVHMYSHIGRYEYPLRKEDLNIAKHSLDLSHDFARGYSNNTSRGWKCVRWILSLFDLRLRPISRAIISTVSVLSQQISSSRENMERRSGHVRISKLYSSRS